MKNAKNMKVKNKITINSLKILIPNFNKSVFITLIINDSESQNSPTYLINKSTTEVYYTFNLTSDDVKTVKFTIYEKASMFSNPIFKGANKTNDFQVDSHTKSLICYLNNNQEEAVAVLYFTMDLESEKNSFEYFQNKLNLNKNSNNLLSSIEQNQQNFSGNDLITSNSSKNF